MSQNIFFIIVFKIDTDSVKKVSLCNEKHGQKKENLSMIAQILSQC